MRHKIQAKKEAEYQKRKKDYENKKWEETFKIKRNKKTEL